MSSAKGTPEEKSAKAPGTTPRKARPPRGEADGEMGVALRRVYSRAVEEPVPDELMALLGKLD